MLIEARGKNMTIRPARKCDWEGIKELIRSNPTKLMQTHLPKLESFFVAVEGGEVVGCCALQVYSRRLAEVRSLAVRSNFRRNGIGKKLITACLKRAKRRKVYEVLGITGAKKLFESFGFGIFQQEKYAMLKVLRSWVDSRSVNKRRTERRLPPTKTIRAP